VMRPWRCRSPSFGLSDGPTDTVGTVVVSRFVCLVERVGGEDHRVAGSNSSIWHWGFSLVRSWISSLVGLLLPRYRLLAGRAVTRC
jgi:hypothetical protein